jgi:hypothetical protein
MFVTKSYQDSSSLQASVENNKASKILSGNCKISIDIMYTLFNYYNSYGSNIVVAQETIAGKSGCSLRSTNGKLGDLHESGIITKIRSKVNDYDTCRYELTDLAFKEKDRILYWHRYFKGLAFSAGLLMSSPQVETRDCVLYCLKDITYTKTADCSSGDLSLKLYSIYSEAQKRREYPPVHHWTTENRENRDQKRPTTKKESSMEQPEWVTPTLNAATKALNLSKWGQIRLSAYPDLAILHALNVFKSSKSAKQDLFKWFSSVCNEWCKKNNAAPEWGLMHRLAVDNDMPDNPNLILEGKPLAIPAAKSKQANVSDLCAKHMAAKRKENQDRIALKDPEDISRERAYLAANPHVLDYGRRLMADMSRWDIEEKVVTEIKDQIVCAQIANDDAVWENLKYSPVDGDELYDEIY